MLQWTQWIREPQHVCSECRGEVIDNWYQSEKHLGLICLECKIKENTIMPNIKITAEVDGKQVPLETVSTETFEAIKALEKPKKIPVARIGTNSRTDDRLILRIDNGFRNFITDYKGVSEIAIDLKTGEIMHWGDMSIYRNIQPL